MSDYVINEPRRLRERLNVNDTDEHRALWISSHRRDGGAGWNARSRTATTTPAPGNGRTWPAPPTDHGAGDAAGSNLGTAA